MKHYQITRIDWTIMFGLSAGFLGQAYYLNEVTFAYIALFPIAVLSLLLVIELVIYPRAICQNCVAPDHAAGALKFAVIQHNILCNMLEIGQLEETGRAILDESNAFFESVLPDVVEGSAFDLLLRKRLDEYKKLTEGRK
jgi:hypothetical protein